MRRYLKTLIFVLVTLMLLTTVLGCSGKSNPEASESMKSGTPSASDKAASTPSAADNVYPENGLPKDQKVTLKFGVWEAGGGREGISYAMKTFTEKFPNVTFDPTFSPDIFKIVSTKIGAGDDKDMFDIFTASNSLADLNALIDEGKLVPQEDLWDRDVYDAPNKKLKDVTLDGLYDGTQRFNKLSYSISVTGWSGGLFYDKAFFEKNGWNQDPKTWDEFTALLDQIKSAGVIPITYPGVYPGYLDFGFGGKDFEIAEENGNLDAFYKNYKSFGVPWYTAPETKEKWNRIYELGKKGYFPAGVAAINHLQSQMQVMQHKAAMVVTGSWVQNEMKDSTPEGFVWGFMGVPPKKEGGTMWLRNGVQGGIFIWAAKPDLTKKWAKEFALWLMNLDIQTKNASAGGSLPVRKDFGDDQARLDALQDAPKAVAAYTAVHQVRFENQLRDVTLKDPAFAQSDKTLQDATPGITNGKTDPGPVLEQAEKLLETAVANQNK